MKNVWRISFSLNKLKQKHLDEIKKIYIPTKSNKYNDRIYVYCKSIFTSRLIRRYVTFADLNVTLGKCDYPISPSESITTFQLKILSPYLKTSTLISDIV